MGIVIVLATEEFFFRALLVQAACRQMRFASATLLIRAVFTGVHIKHLLVVSTLMFSMCVCYILEITHTLALCIAAHFGFNLVALTAQKFFGKTFPQAPEHLDCRVFYIDHLFVHHFGCSKKREKISRVPAKLVRRSAAFPSAAAHFRTAALSPGRSKRLARRSGSS